MKKLFFMLLVLLISASSFAQVRAKVVIGDHQPPHRYHRHVYHRTYVRHYHRYHRRHGIVIKGRL